jgi:hypothetical protein
MTMSFVIVKCSSPDSVGATKLERGRNGWPCSTNWNKVVNLELGLKLKDV